MCVQLNSDVTKLLLLDKDYSSGRYCGFKVLNTSFEGKEILVYFLLHLD